MVNQKIVVMKKIRLRQRQSAANVAILSLILVSILSCQICDGLFASASAVAPPTRASRRFRSTTKSTPAAIIVETSTASTSTSAAIVADKAVDGEDAPFSDDGASTSTEDAAEPARSASNPIAALLGSMKKYLVDFKDGLGQMNTDHKRCNEIRAKQRAFAKERGATRPRGMRGIQTGGITYEEYDHLRKGLIDRNKLFAVAVVSVCLPNYFVYYLWSFPDMMPSPFMKEKDAAEVSRERCHAVISTMLDIEKCARVAPWSSKLNPFGRKATERAMGRLTELIGTGCANMEEPGASGASGGKIIMSKLKRQLYTAEPPTKQQRMLMGNVIPKQIMKGLTKAICADPINKAASPFGIGAVKHVESVTLADEFLVDQSIDLDTIDAKLLAEACSARLIGGPGWTTDERREALRRWLREVEIKPREATKIDDGLHFNGVLARAALMCYNAVDGTRDSRADSSLLRVMYQGQKQEPLILN